MASSFNTVERERSFRHPTPKGSTVPILQQFVAPHIESFNALFPDSTLPIPDRHLERGVGLLGLALKDIGEKCVFDGKVNDDHPFGNKIACEFRLPIYECWLKELQFA
jgi:DNA-directed RNA polymerase I subunit RPA2